MSDDGFGDGTSLPNGSQISNKGAVSDEELEGDDDDQEKLEKDADVFVAEYDKQQKILTKKYEKEHQNYCQRIRLNRNPHAARMTKQGSKKGAEESDDDAGSTKDVEEEPEDFNQFEEEEQEDDSNALEDLERSGPIYGDDANWTPEKASRPQLQESPADKNKSKNKANYVKDNVENTKVPAKTTAAAKKKLQLKQKKQQQQHHRKKPKSGKETPMLPKLPPHPPPIEQKALRPKKLQLLKRNKKNPQQRKLPKAQAHNSNLGQRLRLLVLRPKSKLDMQVEK